MEDELASGIERAVFGAVGRDDIDAWPSAPMPPSPAAAARPWPAATTATTSSPRSPPGPSSGPWGWATPSATPGSSPARSVLDVGSGGGIDTILAARRVGPEGRAIGLDVLEEMCERGRRHAAQAGVEGWTEFRQGEMEAIPLPDGRWMWPSPTG